MKRWLNYIPLVVFLTIGYSGEEAVSKWLVAWKISSVLALLIFVWNRSKLDSIDRIFLGVNIFLLFGGALAWSKLGGWLEIYGGALRGVSLFVIIAVVGVVSTIVSKRGFLNISGLDQPVVEKYSWILVAVSLCSATISWFFRGDRVLEGTLPFLLLYLSLVFLKKLAWKSS